MSVVKLSGRVVAYYKGFPLIKSHNPLIMWGLVGSRDKLSTKKLAMTTKLYLIVTYLDRFLLIKVH